MNKPKHNDKKYSILITCRIFSWVKLESLCILHFFFLQVRKSFFKDINIHNNEALVDILYQQFYSGSKDPPTPENLETIRRLFTSEPYVKSEYQYHRITHKGNVDQNQLHENWTSYLEEFQVTSLMKNLINLYNDKT